VARAGTLAPDLSAVALAGSAAKNSLASLAITAGSGTANIVADLLSSASAPEPWSVSAARSADAGSLVLMVLIHADVLENADSIFRENRQRAIERDQVGSDGLVVDAHETH
jgi:hypothetical protein